MLERGIKVDHSTISRWAIRFLPLLEEIFRNLYSAVDKAGNSVYFFFSTKRKGQMAVEDAEYRPFAEQFYALAGNLRPA